MKNINMLPKIERLRLKNENIFYKRLGELLIITVVGIVIFLVLNLYKYKCQRDIEMENLKKSKIENVLEKTLTLPVKELRDIETYNKLIYGLIYNERTSISSYIKSMETSEVRHMWLDKIDYKVNSFVITGTSIGSDNMSAEERIYEFENKLKSTKLYKQVKLIYLNDSDENSSVINADKISILRGKKFEYELSL